MTLREQSATELMQLREWASINYQRLTAHPQLLPEAIANHYANHAATACHLQQVIAMRHRYIPGDHSPEYLEDIDHAIAQLTRQLTDAHYRDFGTPIFYRNAQ